MLEIVVECERCHQRHNDAAQRAAGRDGEIESGQSCGLRLKFDQLPMADHASGKQRCRVERELAQEAEGGARRRQQEGGTPQEQERRTEGVSAIKSRMAEGDHKGQEIEAERNHPQERQDGGPLGDRVGRGEQQDRAERGIGNPRQERIASFSRPRRRITRLVAPRTNDRQKAACGKQRRKQRIGPGPPACLLSARQQALEGEGIGQEAGEGAEVRGGEETYWIERRLGAREPARQQRRSCGKHDIGHADACSEQTENAPRRVACVLRLPDLRWCDRQQRQAQAKKGDLHLHLTRDRQRPGDGISMRIPCKQRHLKEQQAHEPRRRAAAEPRQDELGEHQLHLEQQEAC